MLPHMTAQAAHYDRRHLAVVHGQQIATQNCINYNHINTITAMIIAIRDESLAHLSLRAHHKLESV